MRSPVGPVKPCVALAARMVTTGRTGALAPTLRFVQGLLLYFFRKWHVAPPAFNILGEAEADSNANEG